MNDLARLAAGTLLVGFDGTQLQADRDLFVTAEFAGYLLFARNVDTLEQTRALTDALRDVHSGLPPLLAIDQEGGRVVRLQDSVEVLPPMMSLGAVNDEECARQAGVQTAHDMRRAGFSLNFAPVLDLAVEPMNLVIGTRAFGSSPARVAALAGAFARGLSDGGIVPTFKHFPGHGSTAIDSHDALPVIEADIATFRARDLAPFAALALNAPAMMSAHIIVRALDPSAPATLSHRLLTDILRDELHFEGVCFTDCMQMDAIAHGIGTVEGVVAALRAGADCALISHDPQLAVRAVQALVDAVESGALARSRLEEAYGRVTRLRAALATPIPLDASAPFPGIGRAIARRAVTCLRGDARVDPGNAIVISFEGETLEGAQGLHRTHPSLREHAPALHEIRLPLDPTDSEARTALADVERSQRRAMLFMRRAHVYSGQAQAVEMLLRANPEALLISGREPFDLALFPQARHAIAVYGDDRASIAGLADVLFGGAPVQGVLPVTLA